MTDLFQFLTDLAIDPDKQVLFEEDPTAVIDAAALSEADKAVLNSRDRATVITALGRDLATEELVAVMGGCYLTDPGPDPEPDPDPVPEDDD